MESRVVTVAAIGQTNVPASLTGVVAIAAGGAHALGLKADGTVAAWGSNGSGESSTNGLNLTNVMAIAAGYTHSLALRNDRTVVAWGNNTYGQTNVPSLISVKLLAAGGFHSLISFFSPWVQYPVDVTKDLLLVYNTNSLDSSNVCAYYLAHRPMVTGANVLPIGCAAQETVTRPDYTNTVRQPILSWLNANPTKRPSGSSNFAVTLGGQTLSLIPLSVSKDYTSYGADIRLLAGQTAQLNFTVFAQNPHVNENTLFLDAIQFSALAVPEPSRIAFAGLAAALLGLRRETVRSNAHLRRSVVDGLGVCCG